MYIIGVTYEEICRLWHFLPISLIQIQKYLRWFYFGNGFQKTNWLAEHVYGNTFHHPVPFCVYYSCKIHKYDHLHLYVKFTLPTEPMQREILGYFLRRPGYKFLSLARSSCAQETSRVLEIIILFVVKKLTSGSVHQSSTGISSWTLNSCVLVSD